ncbi:MAG: hypothetical protein R3C61_28930 [Bacteroidia bacterium]
MLIAILTFAGSAFAQQPTLPINLTTSLAGIRIQTFQLRADNFLYETSESPEKSMVNTNSQYPYDLAQFPIIQCTKKSDDNHRV